MEGGTSEMRGLLLSESSWGVTACDPFPPPPRGDVGLVCLAGQVSLPQINRSLFVTGECFGGSVPRVRGLPGPSHDSTERP